MADNDRRKREALDESFRYYREIDEHAKNPDLFKVVNSLKTVSTALNAKSNSHYKLTKQLWKRIGKALFDTLITSFPGYLMVADEDGNKVEPNTPLRKAR